MTSSLSGISRTTSIGLYCLLASSLCAGTTFGHEITRRSGKAASGTFTSVSPTEIVVKPTVGADIRVPVGDIIRVKFTGEPPRLDSGRNAEQNGILDRALEIYTKAKEDYTGSEALLKADLDFLVGRVTARMALGDPTKLDDAISQLDGFNSKNSKSFRRFEALNFLGELYTAKQDGDKAREVFSQLKNAPLKDYQMAAQVAEGRLLLQENDIAGALASFNAVAAMDASTPAEQSRKFEATLGKATCQQKQKSYDESIATLESVLEQSSAQDTRVQAEAYLRQGDCYQEQQKIKEAVLAYLHVDVLFANEKALHAEALFHLARLWGPAGHQDRAAEAGARLTSDYPNSTWAQKLSSGG